MENFETNDSNKILTNETSSETSDVEGIKEQDVLNTDSSEKEKPSEDTQDPLHASADAQKTTSDEETRQTLEEVTETTGDSEEKPATLEGSKAEDKPSETMDDMMDIYEESFNRFAEGEVVTGRIISVDKDYVLVDIGYKSEGQIKIQEFQDEDGNLIANEGDLVDVMVEWWDDEEERVVLSKEKATKVKVWEEIKKSYDEDQVVKGVIVSRVKGGFSVDIGVQAFLPGSQADLRPIRNLDEMVGKTFTFKILKYNRKRSNIVLSRRVILEEERDSKRSETLKSIEDGKIIDGIVKNITEYGVFVDLGGVDGLLHITDISWGRVKHPSELFSVGDKITVKVLSFDIERE